MTEVNTEENILDFSQAFLEHLYSGTDCFIRLLYLKERNVIERYFRPIEIDSNDFRSEIEERVRTGWNIFYSICGRRDKSGKSEAVNIIPALWIDLDAKDFENDMNEAFKQLIKLPMPTYIIDSGHGYHGLWVLKTKLDANDENIKRVRSILKGLAKATNADAVHDLSRMLRLPGTINFKNKNKPVLCHMAFLSCVYQAGLHAEYTLDDFSEYAIEISQDYTENVKFSVEVLPSIDVATLRVSDSIKKLILEPLQEGGRSEAVYAVVKSLKKAGYTPDEVLSIITHNPIGDRYGQ